MAEQVQQELRFQPGQIAHFRAYQSAIGPHARFAKRRGRPLSLWSAPIGEDVQIDGGPPVVHLAVVERMVHGCDNYAPVSLPASANVLVNGQAMSLTENDTRQEMRSAYEARTANALRAAEGQQPAATRKPQPPTPSSR